MKTPIAVTLVVMGTLLIMTPVIADVLYQQNVVTLMSKSGVTNVNLAGRLGDFYRFGCWFTGTGMVGIAVLCSIAGSASRTCDTDARRSS